MKLRESGDRRYVIQPMGTMFHERRSAEVPTADVTPPAGSGPAPTDPQTITSLAREAPRRDRMGDVAAGRAADSGSRDRSCPR